MPRTARAAKADVCFHVLSRGNARQTIFHDDVDFDRFVDLLQRAHLERPMRLLAWCIMPNHFHLVARPFRDGDLGSWMQWVLTTHVRHHQRRHSTIGRIWQGRFKAFPIQADRHLLAVLRYVERNPVRANLVPRASAWRWSSAIHRHAESGEPATAPSLLSSSPVDLPNPWSQWVDSPMNDEELGACRHSAQRERPYGEPAWVQGTAHRLGLRSTLTPRGRPRAKV